MRSARPNRLSINLLPQDPFYETPIGRVMAWGSTVGRYLVIFTELVVIVSFASRFKLDRDLTDLNSGIQQRSQIVDSYGELENSIRITQTKTGYLVQQKNEYNPISVLDTITQSLPQDLVLTVVRVSSQQIQVTGTALTPEALAQIVRNLQAQPAVSALFVDQIKSNSQGGAGLEFVIHLQLKQKSGSVGNSPGSGTT
ncbi:MAG: Type IV pilus biogenesis protein PilN [Candidatus Amesbacteria bacterium GW2011_GWA2_42_12]|uniref:Type IV pilus biogenesis protein PilN n=1 Tax=Candidatus Amesbacteria bacterium GW2011_GWA2_42_12 TaxID=1618356 RepID=A0A0G0Y142_9BACT|nr:MAG: Type IV pilus biogenesis protein PilN [Candidatus Amesbacteria bacterium GW2011_GWA2_42_12]